MAERDTQFNWTSGSDLLKWDDPSAYPLTPYKARELDESRSILISILGLVVRYDLPLQWETENIELLHLVSDEDNQIAGIIYPAESVA